MNAFKAWCTRRLREESDMARVWSRHGSTRWIWNETKLAEKVCYVLDGQGEPMARWPEGEGRPLTNVRGSDGVNPSRDR